MHSFHYHKGALLCENVSLAQIAKEAGTPVYAYSAETIRDHYRRLDAAFAEIDHLICYAVKANSNLAILKLLAKEGSGFDIVSAGELFRVRKAGGKPEMCTFAGVGKSEEEIRFALRQEILSFNVESESELVRIDAVARSMKRRAPIALRVNPDVEAGTHKYISTGKSENKFGVSLERALDFYEAASKMPNVRIRGIQVHIGSQITSAAPFAQAVVKMSPLVLELSRKYGIEFFSIGGGLGIVYEDSLASGDPKWWETSRALTIESYAAAVVPHLKKLGVRILFEPGRFMVGNSGVLLTRVHYIKKTAAKTFVIVDAGMNDLIRPTLYEGHHDIVPVKRAAGKAKPVVADIVGPICESGDFFAQDRAIPPVKEGDLLAVLSAGAYGFSMASNYNSRPLAAEVLVKDGRADLIRERQSFEDLVRGEKVPEDA